MEDDSWGPGRDIAARWSWPGGHRSPRLPDGPVGTEGHGRQTVRAGVVLGTVVLVLAAAWVALMAFG